MWGCLRVGVGEVVMVCSEDRTRNTSEEGGVSLCGVHGVLHVVIWSAPPPSTPSRSSPSFFPSSCISPMSGSTKTLDRIRETGRGDEKGRGESGHDSRGGWAQPGMTPAHTSPLSQSTTPANSTHSPGFVPPNSLPSPKTAWSHGSHQRRMVTPPPCPSHPPPASSTPPRGPILLPTSPSQSKRRPRGTQACCAGRHAVWDVCGAAGGCGVCAVLRCCVACVVQLL